MIREVKKVYKGNVEVRNYDVEKCIKENKSFTIIYDGDEMTLSPEELFIKRVSVSKTFESKSGGKDYKLYGYPWLPNNLNYGD
jgi:hypothetical protein